MDRAFEFVSKTFVSLNQTHTFPLKKKGPEHISIYRNLIRQALGTIFRLHHTF